MSRLDRWVIAAALGGKIKPDGDMVGRFARIYDLRFVRPVFNERWSLCTGNDGESLKLGCLAHIAMSIAVRHALAARKAAGDDDER